MNANSHAPDKSNSIEKKIFYALAGFFLILMPIMSLNSGISGDEATFHYPHGKNSYNYYATLGKDTTCLFYSNNPNYMYGPVFDVITVAAVKILKPADDYKVRHILNSLTGWAAMFFAALIAVMLGGWRAGIITLLFMFLSPRFLGHSFNNPKDIPFTAAYIFTVYAIIKFLRNYPLKRFKLGWAIALGIGLSIGVRVGGLLLAVYFVLFVGLFYLMTNHYKEWFAKKSLGKIGQLILWSAAICLVGFFIGVVLWPYAHKAPIKNTMQAMEFMSSDTSRIRQIFEGKILWSDYFPKYYLPKYIFISIPIFVILGLASFLLLLRKMKKQDSLWYFILLFTSIFPVAYIIYKASNVYGGWRHVIFIYPGLVVLSALGVNKLIDIVKQKYIRIAVIIAFAALFILPARHIIVNHPYEYIYYNSFVGGVKKAYGRYEMDYFYHSLREASNWLIKNKIENKNLPDGEKIVVATNHADIVNYYFRNYKDKVKVIYIRYYERGNSNWDYALIVNSYINSYQLKKKIWPPSNTIHTVDVDKKPICAILQRNDRNDYEGFAYRSQNNNPEAIRHYLIAIQKDPKYEMVYQNIAESYFSLGDYDKAMQYASACLKLYPDYSNALNTIGMCYLSKNKPGEALEVFMQNIRENPKYVTSYYFIGLIYSQSNDQATALKYLQQSLTVNQNYKPVIYLMAQIYEKLGNKELAAKFMNYANTLP